MEQSAVEFLESQYNFHGQLFKSSFEQAKEMEKEQRNAKIKKAIEEFEEAKKKAEFFKDIIYLDGVLSVLYKLNQSE
jgi:hypothetical protein